VLNPLTYTEKIVWSFLPHQMTDGGWEHVRITLKPRNSDFAPIHLTPVEEGQVRTLAEWVAVLSAPEG
jgi:hypothetical protein